MRPGFLNTEPTSVLPTVESLKGVKKRELKTQLILTAKNAAAAEARCVELQAQLADAKKERDNERESHAHTTARAKSVMHQLMYFKNLGVVTAIGDWCRMFSGTLEFKDTAVVVNFGYITGADGNPVKYGVWIHDTGVDRFELRPFYNNEHTHLKDVPCGGRRVEGITEVVSTLNEFLARREEFPTGAHNLNSLEEVAKWMKEMVTSIHAGEK